MRYFSVYLLIFITLSILSCTDTTDPMSQPSGMKLSILENSPEPLSIDEITALDENRFTSLQGNFIACEGYEPESLWLKINVYNQTDLPREENIIFNHGRVSHLEFYSRSENGEWEKKTEGFTVGKHEFNMQYLYPVSLIIPAKSEKTAFLHLKGNYYKRTGLFLVEKSKMAEFYSARWSIFYTFTFIITVLALLSLYEYTLYKNPTYIYFSLYLFFLWLTATVQWGIFVRFLPHPEFWYERATLFTGYFTYLIYFIFLISFLQINRFSSLIERILKQLLFAYSALFAVMVFFPGMDLSLLVISAGSLVILWIYTGFIIYTALKGYKISRLMFFPFLLTLIGYTTQQLVMLKVMKFSLAAAYTSYYIVPLYLIGFFAVQRIRVKKLLRYYNLHQSPDLKQRPSDSDKNETLSKKTYIKQEDISKLLTELRELMEKEKMWEVENIRISSIAQAMNLPVHHLQELINRHLGMTFSQMINHYRIEAAKNLLLQTPEMKVVEIAYAVSFQSKSSFNTAFKYLTGMTPLEYRSAAESENEIISSVKTGNDLL